MSLGRLSAQNSVRVRNQNTFPRLQKPAGEKAKAPLRRRRSASVRVMSLAAQCRLLHTQIPLPGVIAVLGARTRDLGATRSIATRITRVLVVTLRPAPWRDTCPLDKGTWDRARRSFMTSRGTMQEPIWRNWRTRHGGLPRFRMFGLPLQKPLGVLLGGSR